MIDIRILTPDLRVKLKTPLGVLIRGPRSQTMEKLKKIVAESKPTKIVAVGDEVTKNILRNNMLLDVAIVDGKVMRKPVRLEPLGAERVFNACNPPGTLSEEACKAVEEAMNLSGFNEVKVEGEEDLLTLAAALYAPIGSIVVYGQPKKGIVVIYITEEIKKEINNIVNQMECRDSKG